MDQKLNVRLANSQPTRIAAASSLGALFGAIGGGLIFGILLRGGFSRLYIALTVLAAAAGLVIGALAGLIGIVIREKMQNQGTAALLLPATASGGIAAGGAYLLLYDRSDVLRISLLVLLASSTIAWISLLVLIRGVRQ